MGPQLIHSPLYNISNLNPRRLDQGPIGEGIQQCLLGPSQCLKKFRKEGSTVQERKWILMEHEYDCVEVDFNSWWSGASRGLILDYPPRNPAKLLDCFQRRMKMRAIDSSYWCIC